MHRISKKLPKNGIKKSKVSEIWNNIKTNNSCIIGPYEIKRELKEVYMR